MKHTEGSALQLAQECGASISFGYETTFGQTKALMLFVNRLSAPDAQPDPRITAMQKDYELAARIVCGIPQDKCPPMTCPLSADLFRKLAQPVPPREVTSTEAVSAIECFYQRKSGIGGNEFIHMRRTLEAYEASKSAVTQSVPPKNDEHLKTFLNEASKAGITQLDFDAAQPVPPAAAAVEIGELVRYAGELFKVVCRGDMPGTFDLHVFPRNRAGDQWRNVPEAALTIAQPANHNISTPPSNATLVWMWELPGSTSKGVYYDDPAAFGVDMNKGHYVWTLLSVAQPVPPAPHIANYSPENMLKLLALVESVKILRNEWFSLAPSQKAVVDALAALTAQEGPP